MLTIDIDTARRFILVVLGFWLEDPALGKDEAFAEALARGFARFLTFLGASKLDVKAIRKPLVRRRVESSKLKKPVCENIPKIVVSFEICILRLSIGWNMMKRSANELLPTIASTNEICAATIGCMALAATCHPGRPKGGHMK